TFIVSINNFDFGFLNDLWKYNLTSNEWTWLSGSKFLHQYSVYQQKGEPHPDNVPGSRSGGCLWEDSNGAIWLFGGFGNSLESKGIHYDVYSQLRRFWISCRFMEI